MEHDFDNLRRGAVIQDAGKTRVTMYLDNDVLEHFRRIATQSGRGYQTEINAALRAVMSGGRSPDTHAVHRVDEVLDQLVVRMGRLEQHLGFPAARGGASTYAARASAGYPLRDSGVAEYSVAGAKSRKSTKRVAKRPKK